MAPNDEFLTRALLEQRGMLYGFIYALVRDVGVADEVFQEVAVVAIRKDRDGGEPIREPGKWLREVARRLVKAGFRTRSGRAIEVDNDYLEQVAIVFDATGDGEYDRLSALGDCLEQVSAANRDVLRQRYVLGRSYDEIADRLKRTAGALRVLVHRVQNQLADCVQARLAEQET